MGEQNDAAACDSLHAGRPAAAETNVLERQAVEDCIARRATTWINCAGEQKEMPMTIGSGPCRSVRLARLTSPGQSAYTTDSRWFPRRFRDARE